MAQRLLRTRTDFECAHRLFDVDTYSEECRDNVHGHSYKVDIEISRPTLNKSGMVMDFKLLKKTVKEVITDKYDHACVIKADDPLCKPLVDNCKKVVVVKNNPTAEWMAEIFAKELNKALKKLDSKVSVVSVGVHETEHNIAVYAL